MDPIGVFLCDDVPELRALLRYTFEDDPALQVVGEAGDAATGVELISELRPDVVLLDLSMPGLDGLEAIPMIRERSPGSGIIVFSGFAAERMSQAAVEQGADRYMEKGEPLDRVRQQVHAVAEERRAA